MNDIDRLACVANNVDPIQMEEWEVISESSREDYRVIVRAILQALRDTQADPGLRFYHRARVNMISPLEASNEMWKARLDHILSQTSGEGRDAEIS